MVSHAKELILDLRDCKHKSTTGFVRAVCNMMNVELGSIHYYKGTVKSENIDVRVLDREVYINVFGCVDFDDRAITDLAVDTFGGYITGRYTLHRGMLDGL